MNKGNIAVKWLFSIANKNGYVFYNSNYGEIIVNSDKTTAKQNAGSVYAILIYIKDESKKKSLLDSIKNDIGVTVETLNSIVNGSHWYLLYCGKDITPGSRIRAHLTCSENTGSLCLNKKEYLKGFKIIYGNIYVSNYRDFECFINTNYKPLLINAKNLNKVGNKSKVFKIEN